MKILVSDIQAKGDLKKVADISPAQLFTQPSDRASFHHNVVTHIRAQMTKSDIYVTGRIKTKITLKCARCLEEYEKEYEGNFQQTYDPNQETIDLSGEIRETALIDIPMKALCTENCKGLCIECGKNKNKNLCPCETKSRDIQKSLLKDFPA